MIARVLIGMRGRNQITNGRFESGAATGFSNVATPTTVEIVNGRLHVVADAANDGIGQTVQLELGRKYRLSFDYSLVTATLNLTKVGMTQVTGITGTPNFVMFFKETDGTSRTLLFQLSAAGELYLDNIRLQKVF